MTRQANRKRKEKGKSEKKKKQKRKWFVVGPREYMRKPIENRENGFNSVVPCAALATLGQYFCVNLEFGKVNANENETGDGDS